MSDIDAYIARFNPELRQRLLFISGLLALFCCVTNYSTILPKSLNV